MWPLASFSTLASPAFLPAFAHFHEADHLKDVTVEYHPSSSPPPSRPPPPTPLPLAERVRRLVARETGRRPEGRITLLTHLRYMGYVFNPVSFYYVWDKEGKGVETVVAEVSNTPWNEMHCYVLDPRSPGIKATRMLKLRSAAGARAGGKEEVWRYVFDKDFHVSPFMDMAHVYDWEFVAPREGRAEEGAERGMWVTTHMLKKEGKERYVREGGCEDSPARNRSDCI
ncbi:hypothetical protein NSK_007753 [Nannochloropsis salina CCMP1776]|uniref:DUF1365 domain-containing protein n=1 Tax=Nannochloropsis salina CCMP1776 TaxID=1027361 RepID=A0A4D9CPL7_9STRA|nr:hypothetical protein NSK_007753 [Nannochloropsis salina CCMP1776]|eukprot:TFJ81111.1 hypothetical protein NSK_007753 [Nannochloropsis salina CCMP1776]